MDNDFNIKKESEDLNTIFPRTYNCPPTRGQTIFEYPRRQSLRKNDGFRIYGRR